MRRFRLLLIVAAAIAVLLIAVPAQAAPAANAVAWAPPPQCIQWYTVQCGDTLGNIAWHYGTTAWNLARFNGISNPNLIYPGQTICVKWGAPPPPPPPPPPHSGGFWYTVQPGDQLKYIAARYGWGTWYLAGVNHIPNPDVIYIGQRLFIPRH
jgi:LysM repeat protein